MIDEERKAGGVGRPGSRASTSSSGKNSSSNRVTQSSMTVSQIGFDEIQSAVRRRQLLERAVLGVMLGVCMLFGVVAWATDGRVVTATIDVLRSVEGKSFLRGKTAAATCRNPANRNTPYCLERRAQVDSNWKQISRQFGGEKNQFSLHNSR